MSAATEWALWWWGLVPDKFGQPLPKGAPRVLLEVLTEDAASGREPRRVRELERLCGAPFRSRRSPAVPLGVSLEVLRRRIRVALFRHARERAGVDTPTAADLAGFSTVGRALHSVGCTAAKRQTWATLPGDPVKMLQSRIPSVQKWRRA